MRLFPLFLFTIFSLLLSCNLNQENIEKKNSKSGPVILKKITSNTSLTLWVKGMVCKMACGGSIRKDLKASGAVSRVQINFIPEMEIQEVIVYYDNKLINKKKILDIVSKTNDGQFSAIAEHPKFFIKD